jgi:hypothetical protein
MSASEIPVAFTLSQSGSAIAVQWISIAVLAEMDISDHQRPCEASALLLLLSSNEHGNAERARVVQG